MPIAKSVATSVLFAAALSGQSLKGRGDCTVTVKRLNLSLPCQVTFMASPFLAPFRPSLASAAGLTTLAVSVWPSAMFTLAPPSKRTPVVSANFAESRVAAASGRAASATRSNS